MRIELLWPNGKVTTGSSWEEVEESIRASQPVPYRTKREFRADMRHRAHVWSGRRQKPYPPWTSYAFIRSLANARMFIMVVHDDDLPLN